MTPSNHPGAPMTQFIGTFLTEIGVSAKKMSLFSIPSDGSNRLFWRILPPQSGISFIAMENAPTDDISRRENLSYLRIGRYLHKKGLPVPEIHRSDLSMGWFILEDFGDRNLQEMASFHEGRINLYEKVVKTLLRFQIEGSQGFNPNWCYQTGKYDDVVMRRYESDYFRDSFLCNYLGMKRDWSELEGPFNHLAETASEAESHFFLHRDFQSRNIMVPDGKIGVLDWQGGRLGPLPYDLASLLIDPYVELSDDERDCIYQYYLQVLKEYQEKLIEPFKKYYPYLAIQRNLQILGAFSFLTKVRGRPYFDAYISPALKSLHGLLGNLGDLKLSPLENLIHSLLPIR